ncbi:putative cytosol aminopeptidase [Alphaproteobacteria bacterium]
MQTTFSNMPVHPNSKAGVFFVNNQLALPPLLKAISNGIVEKVIENRGDFKGKIKQIIAINLPFPAGVEIVILVGTGENYKDGGSTCDALRNIGADMVNRLNAMKISHADVYVEDIGTGGCSTACIALGAKLRNYIFNKYYTVNFEEHVLTLNSLNFYSSDYQAAMQEFKRLEVVADSTLMARDLVSEPSNVIYPDSFAKICQELSDFGLKVEVLMPDEMKKLGMGALLGVAQGSANSPRLVILEWYGAKDDKEAQTLAFVGKGVTFDSGGINIKTHPSISDMKDDMGGAAVVVGLMKALARRHAKVNAIGILALVENMPSGTAQRPGDVVKSMSEQTIEIDNTDAEGRLILVDAMWYVQTRYQPAILVDVATLTGAVVVALGDIYAGLFSNNNELAEQLLKAGETTGELVWRFPLNEQYDKQMDSDIADVKNAGQANRGGGAITAAQFLQRFIKDKKHCRWAHIDIAGVCWIKTGTNLAPKGATGFGVRLLEQFVHDNYE